MPPNATLRLAVKTRSLRLPVHAAAQTLCRHSGMHRQTSQKIDDASPDTNERSSGQASDHWPAGTNGSRPPNRSVEAGRGRPQYSFE